MDHQHRLQSQRSDNGRVRRGLGWAAVARHGVALALSLGLLLGAAASVSAQTDIPDAPLPPSEVPVPAAVLPLDPTVDAPVHLLPADNAVTTGVLYPPVGVPTLSWQSVAGATRYNLQISASAGFAETLVDQTTVATAYTPKQVLPDGIYYWRVRAQVEDAWGNFSAAWTFTKDWNAGGELVPQLLAPVDDPAGLNPLNALTPEVFRWEPVSGAASYLLEISVSPSFNDPSLYKATTVKPQHTPVKQFANSTYYWRVTPLDARDNPGVTSAVFAFVMAWSETPSLLTPEDGVDARFLPRFTWTAVPGAARYFFEISTQPNFPDDDTEKVTTPNTSYTLEEALANNQDFFWRVRAINQQGITGPPTPARSFVSDWVYPPLLLSPPTRSIYHTYPYFSWTPVAGAERYRIQIAAGTGFNDMIVDKVLYNATGYSQPEWKTLIFDSGYFWRVRAIDAQGNMTPWSTEGSFRMIGSPPPNLVYPEPYYVPDAASLPVHSDRTIAQPVFVWDTTHQWSGGDGPEYFTMPEYYSVTVASDRQFSNINFAVESAGNAAAPTRAHPFTNLVDGHVYYWKVTPIRDGHATAEGTVWETRIDRGVAQVPFSPVPEPTVSHPVSGFVAVGTAPVLGWLPVSGAAYYDLQVSRTRDFSAVVDAAQPLFAYYVPWQGRRDPMPYGAYWWRVRAMDAADQPVGGWSEVRYFLVAQDLMTGNAIDYAVPVVGTLLDTGELYDPALSLAARNPVTVSDPYEVGDVHIVQDRSQSFANYNWIIAFGVSEQITVSVDYGIYLDVNQLENVGGTVDPFGKSIAVDPLYRPEFVFYLERTGDLIQEAWFYEWTGSSWDGPYSLGGLGGNALYVAGSGVQLTFPYGTITSTGAKFSGVLAATIFSSGPNNLDPVQDKVPAQEEVWSSPIVLSDMLMPLYPFDTPLSNPIIFHELPTVRWRMPAYDSIDGYEVEIARDINFADVVDTWVTYENKTYSLYAPIPAAYHPDSAFGDDESYYWRVRVRHERYNPQKPEGFDTSPWSPPMRFKLASYVVGNPTVSLTGTVAATPSFLWERVEGAAGYTIQIDNDANMSSPLFNVKVDGTSYTPLDTLADGTYYWRVAMRRSFNVTGQWSPTLSFVKQSLSPLPVRPVGGEVVNTQPTFVWTAVYTNVGELRVAMPKYRLQWDNDPNFGSPKSVDTEATAFTPSKGSSLEDGTWYWRVATMDVRGRLGAYSPTQTFYKEYLAPGLVSPPQGSSQGSVIRFEWTPLAGAAYYYLEIADNDAYNAAVKVTTESTQYTHIAELDDAEYFWRVRMYDRDRVAGPFVPGRFDNAPDPIGPYKLFVPSVPNSGN